jgi:hypothetical protein
MWERFDDGREKDPWQFTNQVVMMDPETGQLYTFVTASKGGLGAVGEIAKAFGRHIRMSPGEVPLIKLQMRSYPHPTYGEIRVPKFDLVEWVAPPQELLAASSGETVDEEADVHETPPPRKTSAQAPRQIADGDKKVAGKPNKQSAPQAPARGKNGISERAKSARVAATGKKPAQSAGRARF